MVSSTDGQFELHLRSCLGSFLAGRPGSSPGIDSLLWLHAGSDLLIGIAYFVIPLTLLRIARRRSDLKGSWILLCFGSCIAVCGLAHIMEVLTLWHSWFWLSGALKALTAVLSLVTCVLLLRLTPVLLAVPSPAALRTANRKLASVLESTSACLFAVEKDWTISYMNGPARALLAASGMELGNTVWEALPDQAEETVKNLRHVMETRQSLEFESYYPPLELWTSVHAHPWEGGGMTVFFNDVGEQKRLQRELHQERALREQRLEALAQMAGGLAHEISNPLGIIHARASDLLEVAEENEPLSPALVGAACGSIVNTSNRAMRILKGLRMFTREGARDPMAQAEVTPLVEQTVALVQQRFKTHGVELGVRIDPQIARISCREVQIAQVLFNLLNNAFDAIDASTGSERWVRLEACSTEQEVVIEVIDSGPGVDEANKPHLMQPFFSTKPVGAGMGLGLSLSRAIARDHGGELVLRESEGSTCFRLTLPALSEKEGGVAA